MQVLQDEDLAGAGVGTGFPHDWNGDFADAKRLRAEADAEEQARAEQDIEALLVAEQLDEALRAPGPLALAAALGEEAMNGEQVPQHVGGDPRLIDQQRELGRPGGNSMVDRAATNGAARAGSTLAGRAPVSRPRD